MTSPTTLRVIFIHLPKTGGMTLRNVVARQYRRRERLEFTKNHLREYRTFLRRPQVERDAYRLLYGHMSFGYHQAVSGESRYLTMLRNPVDRVISQYYAGLLKREKSGQGMSLEEWVSSTLRGNAMTRMLIGFRPDAAEPAMYDHKFPLPDDAAEIAIRNLTTHFAVVGLTKSFDVSLLLMRRAFGWEDVGYVPTNIGARRRKLESVSAEARAAVEHYSAVDFQVYQAAKALFEAQVAAYGSALDADLAALAERKVRYARRDRLIGLVRDSRIIRALRARVARR